MQHTSQEQTFASFTTLICAKKTRSGLFASLSKSKSKLDLKLQRVSLDEVSMDLIALFSRSALVKVFLARCRRLNSMLCGIFADSILISVYVGYAKNSTALKRKTA